jgi:activating signal cointegrator 1
VKALTLTQPWATLVQIRAKRIETRSWSTSYRGRLAIHAAKGFPKWAKMVCGEPIFHSALYRAGYDIGLRSTEILPVGCVIATCVLIRCRFTQDVSPQISEQEEAFGDYYPGRYAWFLSDIIALPEPIPAKGALGLWEWDAGEALLGCGAQMV